VKEALSVNTTCNFNTYITADEVPDSQSLQGNKIKAIIIIIVLSFQSLYEKQEVSSKEKQLHLKHFHF